MNDWDFSFFDKFSYVFIAVLLIVILYIVIKNKRIRNIIKILLFSLIVYSLFIIVQFNINIAERDNQREINIDKLENENRNKTYWGIQKNKFKYENLNTFFFDSNLISSYKQLTPSVDPFLTNKLSGKIYLYSWQNRNDTTDEFTVIEDNGEQGLKIYYIIFDKNNTLISYNSIGGIGREGIFIFEHSSEIKNKDSLLTKSSITQWWDLENNKKMENPKGDTIFSYLLIDSNQQFKEVKFKESKSLNYQ